MPQPPLNSAPPAALGLSLALLLSAAPARAVDWMNMVQTYGDNVFSTLQTELLQPQIARPSGGEAAPRPQASWPAHLAEPPDLSRHVFSIGDLAAMEAADRERLRALVDGREITAEGVAEIPERADKALRLRGASGETGYHLWASWRGARPEIRPGAPLRLRGIAQMERRSFLSMREAEVLAPGPLPAPIAPTAPAAQLPPDSEALRFSPSPEVSAELAEILAEGLAPALAPGRSKAELLELLRGEDLRRGFAQALGAYGFSDRDMADVLTGHLVLLWQTANDRPEDPPREGILALRDSIREALSRAEWPRRLEDAQKQRFSETLALGSMLIALRYLHGKETGNAAAVSMARRDARETVLSYGGPDPSGFDLTPEGFVAKP